MSAATVAAIAIATYPLAASAYLFVSSDRIRRDLFCAVSHELRSRTPGGSEEVADLANPRGRSVPAGVERRGIPHHVAAPPAPCPLVGAVFPAPAPTRPPRVMVHG